MVASRSDYKHLSVMTMKTQYGEMYQLRLSSKLGRKTIGLGGDKLTALNLAVMVDEEISRLIALGELIEIDSLKDMVKSEQAKFKAKKTGSVRLVEKDDLIVLWDNYVKFHVALGTWTETYITSHIALIRRLLNSCPFHKLEDKQQLIEWIFNNTSRTKKTSKSRFMLIVAAIDWNSKQGNIPRKWGIEYRDALESINIKTEKKCSVVNEEDDIDIFSVDEVYRILEALKNETYSRRQGRHYQYYKYVYFCWLTGCRPSEAIALKWENVDLQKKRIKFCEAEMNRGGLIIKKQGTKTVSHRYFPINPELMELLNDIPHRKGYVFKNIQGKPINHNVFYRVWKLLLENMGIKYRVPYQLRHTMISYHANNDYPIHKLAELVGNSEQIIKEHYLKLDIERINLPDVIK
ncbi:site-specific integrase [Nostoc sp. PCC 7120 = FACHB-418]|uniref:Site-specific integrase n=4 Tax=Nostocales TaxID=1161 RepID=A0ABR7ZCF2_ANACY|nr:site-specific integrase [Anabaena sp. FACHB-709]MBD2170311.1 site-specific integrase [Anabaena cylindrica FACHB-318]MBD2271644.1 site-specific integrase [Nostoc sp. PCC 7120 = FACHB-418]MBD2281932.1 site-specific integrase [Anabaena cylindrica FACHB-170]MBD2347357.1 site-specific integrase [Trichormus variabilis FACHB-171]BAY68732.1 putative integrase [Trichormus variabilis NIES-23]HBW33623.1 site-specific integrase [Nostoc sp. UBA8866]